MLHILWHEPWNQQIVGTSRLVAYVNQKQESFISCFTMYVLSYDIFAIIEVTPTGVTRPKIHDCDATSTWYIQVVYGDSKVHGRSSNFNQCTVHFWGL